MTTYKDLQDQAERFESYIRNNPKRMNDLFTFFGKYVARHGYDMADIMDRLYIHISGTFRFDYEEETGEKIHVYTLYRMAVSFECDMEERYK